MSDAPSPGRLAGLTPGAGPGRFADAERHRLRVKRLKIALPLLAAAFVAAIFVSLVLNRRPDMHVAGGGSPAIEMSAPVLKGVGDNGKPFEVSAAQAAQTHEGVIDVTDVKARMELEDGVVTMVAQTGQIAPDANTASVRGGVHIQLGDTYTFDTEQADADMKAGIVTGNVAVRVTGPMGTIDAAGFKVEKSIRRVTFTGGVNSVINPAATKDKPKEETR